MLRAPAERVERCEGRLAAAFLHGDTHLGNVIIVGRDSGVIWMDLEAACIGPREWDVGVKLPAATWSEFGALDPALLSLFV